MSNHDTSDTWFRTESAISPPRYSFRYRPSIRRLLTPKLEEITRVLWLNRDSLTEGDRVWVKERIDQMFDARLGK